MSAHLISFMSADFQGGHHHLFQSDPSGPGFTDSMSSFVILEGEGQFFRDVNFGGPASRVFGPGLYPSVEAVGIPNDSVTSIKLADDGAQPRHGQLGGTHDVQTLSARQVVTG